MPQSKKRSALREGLSTTTNSKKVRLQAEKPDWICRKPGGVDAEYAFDSDPIEESATTEGSGEDDGISWTSATDRSDGGSDTEPPLVETGQTLHMLEVSQSGSFTIEENQKSSSKASHAKQKALALERKAGKQNADIIANAKRVWEKLRMASMSMVQRKVLLQELLDILSGRIKDLVLKHDAGRIVQTALKYCNQAQRRSIAAELSGEYKQLAMSKYAKFTIGKLLSSKDEVICDTVVPEFYGSVRSLIKHPEAGWILDDIYRGAATNVQKSRFMQEWYGPEFAIFKKNISSTEGDSLRSILAAKPEKKSPIMQHLFDMINLLVQKRMTGFTMLHDAMLQYYLNVEEQSLAASEFVNLVMGDEEGDLVKNLAFTESGARLVCLMMAYGSAKHRKAILRMYRGHITTLAYDHHGYKVLMTALEIIDDTVLTAKLIYGEMIVASDAGGDGSLLEQLQHATARIPLLIPFAHNVMAIVPKSGQSLLDEVRRIRANTSKKDSQIRSSELVRSVSPVLLSCIARQALNLLRSSFGCLAIQEILLASPNDLEERCRAVDAIISVLNDNGRGLSEGKEQALVEDVFDAPASTRLLKNLVYSGYFDAANGDVKLCAAPLGLAPKLYEVIFANSACVKDLIRWATGFRSFVVEAMLRSEDMPAKYKAELYSQLQDNVTELRMAANVLKGKEFDPTNASGRRKKEQKRINTGKEKLDKSSAAQRVGARGAKSILDLLGESNVGV